MPSSNAIANAPAAPTVGRETLEETPQRALKLLRAIGTSMPIQAALAAHGYGDEDHQKGWSLLHAASGYAPARAIAAIDTNVRDAIRAIDAWDEDGFRIVRATFERRYPELAAKVLGGIGPSNGAAAVVGVKALLERLDQLEKSKDGHAHEAMALLAKRGIDKAERKRLHALVAQAETAPDHGDAFDTSASDKKTREETHLASLTALRIWYEEWSEMARAVVKRRDYLILLGLAKRKRKAPAVTPPSPAPTPTS